MGEVTIAVDKQVVQTLIKTRDLIEELLETFEILNDRELMGAIRESEKELREGKTRPFKEFWDRN
ncbi:MAG: hypothetical protein QME59_01470 [Candidatus Hydrothermarchaeota archaeon]|nr:hypothetical protein [Candidatus Hydrothermarchaeota archaeon]